MIRITAKEIFVMVVVTVCITAVLILVYRMGMKKGYEKLEKEIVYTIASGENKRVGNFTISHLQTAQVVLIYQYSATPNKWRK